MRYGILPHVLIQKSGDLQRSLMRLWSEAGIPPTILKMAKRLGVKESMLQLPLPLPRVVVPNPMEEGQTPMEARRFPKEESRWHLGVN